jgi:predicted Zn-dependent protease
LLKSSQPEAALEHCKKLVAEHPDEGNYYRLLSNCYAQLGETAAQLQVDEQFVDKFPNHQEFTAVSQSLPYLRRDVEQSGKAVSSTGNKPTNDELYESWIKAKMPLKVFIKPMDEAVALEQDNSGLPENNPDALIQRAMDEWTQASQGRISFVMTSRIDDAQITLECVDSPNGLENEFAAGVTGFSDANPANPQRPIKLLVINRKSNKPLDRGRFYEAALHEFGHALGLAHSPIATDIMYRKQRPQPITQLSDNDRDRLVKLYTAL